MSVVDQRLTPPGVHPGPVPAGTVAALIDALRQSSHRQLRKDYGDQAPTAQINQLAYDTGLPGRTVTRALHVLAYYRMAREQPDGLWKLHHQRQRPPMRLGTKVNTPHGPGTIVGYKTVSIWGHRGPGKRQLVIVKYDSPTRVRPGHWFPDAIKLMEEVKP